MQRAKRALKAQLKLRSEAARRAQQLRTEESERPIGETRNEDACGVEQGWDGGEKVERQEREALAGELVVLEGRIASISQVFYRRNTP